MHGLRLVGVMIVSAALMMWGTHHPVASENWRSHLSGIATPLIDVANAPFVFFDSVSTKIQDKDVLVKQNQLLQAKSLILEGELQKLKSLEAENQALRELLHSNPVLHNEKLMLADVMAVQSDPFHQTLMINKGSHDGVYAGQVVLDAHGIMGQVINVSLYNSTVLLLTDPQSGIPIQDNQTGLHGILTGKGNSGLLNWKNLVSTVDIKTGDKLVSSGLGGRYPAGYPVGTISRIRRYAGDPFLHIRVIPSAKLDSTQQVLLLWPDKNDKNKEKKS